MKCLKFIVFWLSSIWVSCNAATFYVTAPNHLRLNSDENAYIAVEGENAAIVNVYVQDYPGKARNITFRTFQVNKGNPVQVTINLKPERFPPNFLINPSVEKFVLLVAHSNDFHKEIKIPISQDVGYVFIQTDKPMYGPGERAHFRIISLNEDIIPSNEPFTLQIKNPQNKVAEEKMFNQVPPRAGSEKEFMSHSYLIPKYALAGDWTATVKYGYKLLQNTTVEFHVDEYILPTFTVELETPDVILEKDKSIQITVTAKYVFGKEVAGSVIFILGVEGKTTIQNVMETGSMILDNGKYILNVDTDEFRHHEMIGWFPNKKKLVVTATVTDAATGKQVTQKDYKCQFAESPYVISFPRSLREFRPGLKTVIVADISFVDGRPAAGIPTIIEAFSSGRKLHVNQNRVISNAQGRVTYVFKTERNLKAIQIIIKTTAEKYPDNQAVGRLRQQKFVSKNNAYIAIDKSVSTKPKINEMFVRKVYFEPDDFENPTYFTVSSKGKIIFQNMIKADETKENDFEFEVTSKMMPSFRLTVFTHYKEELLIDSISVDIEETCSPEANLTIELKNKVVDPGHDASIDIKGAPYSLVGLLGVDEAVYTISRDSILTGKKVLKALAKHDLGCGAGGGLTTDMVMANAGLLIASNHHTPSTPASDCVRINRRKRSIAEDILSNYVGFEKKCCFLGISRDDYRRTCEARRNIVRDHLEGNFKQCTVAFLKCCKKAEELNIAVEPELGKNGFKAGDEIIILSEEMEIEQEKDTTIRKHFKTTWSEDIYLGGEGNKTYKGSLPDSITTWLVQAFSVSKQHGICVAKPQQITVQKKVFLQLDHPYSLIRNEQVNLQATVFNYANKRIRVTVYMYGVAGLCTGAHEKETSERKKLFIEIDSTATVTFPIIPLEIGQFTVKVVAVSSEGSDVIEKRLNVVPEGTKKEFQIAVILDPTNHQRRKGDFFLVNDAIGIRLEDSIDDFRKIQHTSIVLSLPPDLVPDTESYNIVALGDPLGPSIETAVKNPDDLVSLPTGCGEQNMMRLAPTLYTMRYLKVAGKMTPELEEQGYSFIRLGYGNVITHRKDDGSYSTFIETSPSTWLTAFVIKVFCQANELVYIDETVISSGLKWLIDHQEPDGSFIEHQPLHHSEMVGGVQGKLPMTAYVLIALEECKKNIEDISIKKARAISYLEQHLNEADKPLPAAVVAYALALSDSANKRDALKKLMEMVKYDENANLMHWGNENSATDVEATSYALLTQIIFDDFTRANAIVNWLNSQQLQTGSFHTTQDTVIALQALSEYGIKAQRPPINLVVNISSDTAGQLPQSLVFNERNAHILQATKQNAKTGKPVTIDTSGTGIGQLILKLKYNVFPSEDEKCMFSVTINATKSDIKDDIFNHKKVFVKKKLNFEELRQALDPDADDAGKLQEEINEGNNDDDDVTPNWKFAVCVKYLGNENPGMTIVDVGIFPGFEPDNDILCLLKKDPYHKIEKYEKYNTGILFYLRTVPTQEFYCFDFDALQKYDIGSTKIARVQVYDYYIQPEVKCSVFYAPDNKNPLLHKSCIGTVCQCAEGGCPSKDTLQVGNWKRTSMDEKVNDLTILACDKFNFVWRGKLAAEIKPSMNGYHNISFRIEKVIKEGAEKKEKVLGSTRNLLARDICNEAIMIPDREYLIMGNDGKSFLDGRGNTWYRYMLDKKSIVYLWTTLHEANDFDLRRPLGIAMDKLERDGCHD